MGNPPPWEEVLVGIAGELSLIILDAAHPKTILILPGDVAVIPQNTWASPIIASRSAPH
jgi:hypothetical protein